MRKDLLTEMDERWTKIAHDMLIGKTITHVRYLSAEEARDLGWDNKSVVIHLRDKNGKEILIYPSRDDEGNDAGALFTTDATEQTLPVLPA